MGRPSQRTHVPLGRRLHERIKELEGMTLPEFIRLTSESRRQLYAYMYGDASPSIAQVAMWADVLGCSPSWLAYGHGKP